jgi:tRNA 2-thiouridine synthesizing protein E
MTSGAGRGLPLAFDQDGFLLDWQHWSREVSQTIAELDGIGPLDTDHWAVIAYLREHYLTQGSLPPLSHVCHDLRLEHHAVQHLFGSCREAWRVAGLPNPGEEVKTYM